MSQTKAQLIDPVDGTIVNADINASAAIAGSKISPDFGSQNITTTGIIKIADGSVSAPALAFTDDLDTGIFSVSQNTINFTTSGVERLEIGTSLTVFNDGGADVDFRIEGSGEDNLFKVDAGNDRIGIGTSSPDNLLHLFESSTTQTADASSQLVIEKNSNSGITILSGNVHNGRILFGDSGDNDIGQIDYDHNSNYLRFVVNGGERLRIDSSGNVGIGTSSPLSLLHVKASSAPTLRIDDSDTSGVLAFQQDGVNGSALLSSAGTFSIGVSNDNSAATLTFLTRNNERMRIDSSGKIGIGTASPATDIHTVSSSDHIITHQSTTTGADIRMNFRDSGNTDKGGIHYLFNGNSLKFITAESERMRLNSSGNLGIGTTSPSTLLHLQRSSTTAYSATSTTDDSTLYLLNSGAGGQATVQLQVLSGGTANTGQATISAFCEGNSSKSTSLSFGTRDNSGNAPAERMRIDSSGNVGIGTISADNRLHIESSSNTYLQIEKTGTSSKVYLGNVGGEAILESTGEAIKLKPNGRSNDFVLNTAGDLGIGTATPTQAKLVASSSSGTQLAAIKDNNGASLLLGGPTQPRILLETVPSASDLRILTAAGSTYGSPSYSERIRFLQAGGITFNGDTAQANAIDDYEEGTFTPSFGFSSDNFNGSYSAQGGSYTKIGNIVNVRFQIAATKGTGTGGTATVYNLPFTPVNTDNYRGSGVMGYYEGFTSDKPILILVEQNQTQFPFRHSGDTTAQSIGAANMSSSFRFYISITYQTA